MTAEFTLDGDELVSPDIFCEQEQVPASVELRAPSPKKRACASNETQPRNTKRFRNIPPMPKKQPRQPAPKTVRKKRRTLVPRKRSKAKRSVPVKSSKTLPRSKTLLHTKASEIIQDKPSQTLPFPDSQSEKVGPPPKPKPKLRKDPRAHPPSPSKNTRSQAVGSEKIRIVFAELTMWIPTTGSPGPPAYWAPAHQVSAGTWC